MTTNPYAPPTAAVSDPAQVEEAPALWNPNAAANWSLVFSPAFGSFLHMLNWEALGEPERAVSSRRWFVASIAILLATAALALMLEDDRRINVATRMTGFVYLFTWYFAAGRPQVKYVKERFGKSYPRRRWWKPMFIAVAGLIGYVLLAGVAAYLMETFARA